MDDLELFVSSTITTEEGYLQLLLVPDGHEEFYKWPEQRQEALDRIRSVDEGNVYFSPHLFSKRESLKVNALPSRTLCVDLDAADVTDLQINPTFLLETSPGRHQGFWILKEELSIEEFETLSKKLSYTILNADHSGWPIGHKFRLPGTKNFKYNPPATIRTMLSLSSESVYSVLELKQWVQETDVNFVGGTADDQWINNPPVLNIDAREVLEKYREKIGPKIFALYDEMTTVRHEALWALMMNLFRAGADRDEVYWICRHSQNNKFVQDQHYNADRDLAKDVDRARRSLTSQTGDVSQLVIAVEKSPGTNNDKRRTITRIVLSDMLRKGEFVFTDDGRYWYVHTNAGRPISIGKRSEQLDSLLDMAYGLNSQDGLQPYITTHLANYTIAKGKRAKSAVLSSFDGESTLLLHSGKADVFRITPNVIERGRDGSYGVLFPWRNPVEENIFLDDSTPPWKDGDWSEWLFEGWFDNLLDFTPEEARVILKIWIIFLLLRDAAVSRPILAVLGQPGSGKSTLFRLLYVLIYGRFKSLNAVSTPEDFDFLSSADPLVVFDNVDTWANWLPDRLALSASSSDLTKRKLYTDGDTWTVKRQAILGITAHDPHFGRADVVDRMILINLSRRDHFTPEGILMDRVYQHRPQLWNSIVLDVQKVLAHPSPVLADIPEFRISDFARVGTRIAQALGHYDQFVSIIGKLRGTQVAFSLSTEEILIDSLLKWMPRRNGDMAEFVSPGYIWEQLKPYDDAFAEQYKNSAILGRRLWTMRGNLQTVLDVDFHYDQVRGIRSYQIMPKGTAHEAPKVSDNEH